MAREVSFCFFYNSSGLDLVVGHIFLVVPTQVKIRHRQIPFPLDAMGHSSKAQLPWLLWSKHQNSCLQEMETLILFFQFYLSTV